MDYNNGRSDNVNTNEQRKKLSDILKREDLSPIQRQYLEALKLAYEGEYANTSSDTSERILSKKSMVDAATKMGMGKTALYDFKKFIMEEGNEINDWAMKRKLPKNIIEEIRAKLYNHPFIYGFPLLEWNTTILCHYIYREYDISISDTTCRRQFGDLIKESKNNSMEQFEKKIKSIAESEEVKEWYISFKLLWKIKEDVIADKIANPKKYQDNDVYAFLGYEYMNEEYVFHPITIEDQPKDFVLDEFIKQDKTIEVVALPSNNEYRKLGNEISINEFDRLRENTIDKQRTYIYFYEEYDKPEELKIMEDVIKQEARKLKKQDRKRFDAQTSEMIRKIIDERIQV